MGPEADLVKPRFDRGCRCFAVLIDGAVAGYGWLSTRPEWVGEVQVEIRPGPGEGYIWNCATLGPHRQKGVFRSLLVGISEIARSEGLRRLWIGSVAIPAEKALAPSGFEPLLRFNTLRFAGLDLITMREFASGDPQLILSARRALGLRARRKTFEFAIRRLRPRRH